MLRAALVREEDRPQAQEELLAPEVPVPQERAVEAHLREPVLQA